MLGIRTLGLALVATVALASEDTPANTALKTFLDVTFQLSDLTSSDRDRMAELLEDCSGTTTPFTAVLDDAVDANDKCVKAIQKKSNSPFITAKDNEYFTNCTIATRDTYIKHGGINFLAAPVLTTQNLATLKECSDGSSMAKAFGVVLNRYTPCELAITSADEAIFARAIASSTRGAGEQRKASLQAICSSLYAFEQLNGVVARFATSNVNAFLYGITDFSQ